MTWPLDISQATPSAGATDAIVAVRRLYTGPSVWASIHQGSPRTGSAEGLTC